jgi:hypothetical protein
MARPRPSSVLREAALGYASRGIPVLDIDGPTGAHAIQALATEHDLQSSGPLVWTGRGWLAATRRQSSSQSGQGLLVNKALFLTALAATSLLANIATITGLCHGPGG